MIILRRFLGLLLLGALGGLGGCATTGGNPDDPLERYNRAMFSFNDDVDKAIIKPVASGYKAVMPEFARTGVTNFFANLGDVWIGVNNMLQGKVGAGVSDFGRFAINTTVGILGLFDVASNAGLEKHNEDFGQTLGRWGMGSGAYVVLPFLGPSSVRDGFSLLVVDWHGDPLWYVGNVPTRNELYGVRVVDTRANLLEASQLMEEAALDRYSYLRGAYLQRRRSLVYDGNPPREPDPDRTSESVPRAVPAAQTGGEVPPARLVVGRGEPVTGTADEAMTPAREFSAPRPQLAAAGQSAGGARSRRDDSINPGIQAALPELSGEVHAGLQGTGP